MKNLQFPILTLLSFALITSNLPAEQGNLKLWVDGTPGQNQLEKEIRQYGLMVPDPSLLKPTFKLPATIWTAELDNCAVADSATANLSNDVNGDGVDDIVVATYWCGKSGPNQTYQLVDNYVYLLSGADGRKIWTHTLEKSNGILHLAVHQDVDGDGIKEIAVIDNRGNYDEGNTLRILNGRNGSELWSYNYPHINTQDMTTIPSINNDSIPDIIIGTRDIYGSEPRDDEYSVLLVDGALEPIDSHQGRLLWQKDLSCPPEDVSSIVDVNNDRIDDVVVGGLCSPDVTYVLSGEDGRMLWSQSEFGGSKVTTTGIEKEISISSWESGSGDIYYRDINFLSSQDIIATPRYNDSAYINRLEGEDGHLIWSFNLDSCSYFGYSKTIHDITEDGSDDILTQTFCGNGSSETAVLLLNGNGDKEGNGEVVWSFSAMSDTLKVISDVNADGKEDVIFNERILGDDGYTYEGKVYLLNSKTGQLIWVFNMGEGYPEILVGVDDLNGQGESDIIVSKTIEDGDDANGKFDKTVIYALSND